VAARIGKKRVGRDKTGPGKSKHLTGRERGGIKPTVGERGAPSDYRGGGEESR